MKVNIISTASTASSEKALKAVLKIHIKLVLKITIEISKATRLFLRFLPVFFFHTYYLKKIIVISADSA